MAINKKLVEFENQDSAFDQLKPVASEDFQPVDLRSKLLKFKTKRNHRREVAKGSVILFDLRDRILCKATFKNLSPEGASFEIANINLKINQQVILGFASNVQLGAVLCVVQWIHEIEGHKSQHKHLGLKFKKLTPLQMKELKQYLSQLQEQRENPIYIG